MRKKHNSGRVPDRHIETGRVRIGKKVWVLSEGPESDGWKEIRVSLIGSIRGKANYRMCWSEKEGRWSASGDIARLANDLPEAYLQVTKLIGDVP